MRFENTKISGMIRWPVRLYTLLTVVVVLREQRRRVVLGAVDHAGLQRAVELVEAHRDAVAAHRVHRLDEDRVAHHPDLLPFRSAGLVTGLFE